jgi:group I intron endonuclease
MCYIYKITNLINGSYYIGKTSKSSEYRFEEHKADSKKAKNKHRHLYRAFNKYGVDNFIVETIATCIDNDDAIELEKFYIKFTNSYKDNRHYNMSPGGDGGSGKCSDETKAKIGKANSGRIFSEATREKMSKSSYRHPASCRPVRCIDTDEVFETVNSACDKYGLHRSNIAKVCQGKLKTTGGFRWAYI